MVRIKRPGNFADSISINRQAHRTTPVKNYSDPSFVGLNGVSNTPGDTSTRQYPRNASTTETPVFPSPAEVNWFRVELNAPHIVDLNIKNASNPSNLVSPWHPWSDFFVSAMRSSC